MGVDWSGKNCELRQNIYLHNFISLKTETLHLFAGFNLTLPLLLLLQLAALEFDLILQTIILSWSSRSRPTWIYLLVRKNSRIPKLEAETKMAIRIKSQFRMEVKVKYKKGKNFTSTLNNNN